MKRRTLSYSQYRLFTECLFRWREQYVHKAGLLEPASFAFGGFEHEAIQAYIEHLVRTKQSYAPQDIVQVWRAFITRRRGFVPEPMLGPGFALLEKFSQRFRLDLERLWDPEPAMAITYEGKPTDWWAGDAWLRGRPDLAKVDGWIAELDDWKTSWAPMSDEEWQQSLQAQTYAFLMSCWNPKIAEVRVTADFVRFGIRRTATFTKPEFEETWALWRAFSDNVQAALEELQDDQAWPATPGSWCQSCPVIFRCPIGAQAITEVVLASDPDAEGAAQRVLVLDSLSKTIKDALKAWVAAAGHVKTSGYEFGFFKSESFEYDVNQMIGLAKRFFIEPTVFLKVDTQKLKALARREGPFMAEVEKIRRDTGDTSFRYRRWSPEAVE